MLLISRAADQEAAELRILLRKTGIPCARLDVEAASTADLVVDLNGRAVRLHGHWIRPAVTWVRHFSARALTDQRGPAHQMFLRDSWQALGAQLAAISSAVVKSQGPGLLGQLALAAASGIQIPRTVVATSPAQACPFLPTGRQILKAVHCHFIEAAPGLLTGIFPECSESSVAGRAAGPPGPPVVVQEYVDHDLEIRAYYVRGEILTFEVGKSAPADPWVRPERLTVRQAEPPAAIRAATTRLANAMSLEYGAFDFLTSNGRPTFLEVNLTGDWRWIETRIGKAPVTLAVARMLRDLYLASATERRPGATSIELTTFLSGGRRELPGCY